MRTTPRITDVVERAQDLYSRSRSLARRGSKKANSFIHSKPVLSTLLGVAAGYFLSSILRSRD
jgi:hypothetical protein